MKKFLFRKLVDKSLLKDGLTIPKTVHDELHSQLGVTLLRGEQREIRIHIGQAVFDARLTNVNYNEQFSHMDTFQIRYAQGTPICQELKRCFAFTTDALASAGNSIDEKKEFLDVFALPNAELEFRCYPKSMKADFFKYLGDEKDLTGYQRSYKLVLLKAIFENWNSSGEYAAARISEVFQKYYITRKQQGLEPDKNVDPIIENVETSSIKSIYNLILTNPYNAIQGKGFLTKVTKNEKEYFKLPERLIQQFESNDVAEVLRIINRKLELYYAKIGSSVMTNGKLNETINRILNEYVSCKVETFAGHPMGFFFRNDIPPVFYDTNLVDKTNYLVVGSVGQGNWATVPWICIFDRQITTSATKGVYIVYLLSKDGNTLYLTFNQGCTQIRNTHSKKDTIRMMREKAAEITHRISSRGFSTDEGIDLGDGLTDLAELYQKGTIFYKAYHKGNVPPEAELQDDLRKMMEIYQEYAGRTLAMKPEDADSTSNTWLLTWNPANWNWEDYQYAACITEGGQSYDIKWSCANTHVKKGDRVFLSVLGTNPKGIIASGYATSESYVSVHWDEKKAQAGETTKRIDVSFDWIIDYHSRPILEQTLLKEKFPLQKWDPQNSGISIKLEYISGLEALWQLLRQGGEEEVPAKETLESIKKYITAKGFSYEAGLLENFYLSLKSKPFVILAGTSGTGKTRLVKLFSEALGATTSNGRYKMVSVRPDWSDSSDLFGHVDLNGHFCPGAIIDFVKDAAEHPDKPYFLCLDEMNLARVEYYLSDFLSVIETRDKDVSEKITSDPLVPANYFGSDDKAKETYGTLLLPENLYVIGTVNMDETTFPFSRKVLDRANTIEFSYVDLMPHLGESAAEVPSASNVSNAFLKTEYLLLAQCAEDAETVNEYCSELQQINKILQKASAHVGYRVRDEIVFYLLNNKKNELLPENEAMDNELMQKILPRIQGSSVSIKNMLCELFKHCIGDYDGYEQNEDVSAKMMKALANSNCKYKRSAEKLAFMVRRFEEDGFTSYWL